MRIAYLTADFGVPVLGTKGASAHVRGLVQSLQQLGSEVFVLAANPGTEAHNGEFPLWEVPFGASLLELYGALKAEPICDGNRLAKDLRNVLYALSLEIQGRLMLAALEPEVIYERYCLFSTAGLELARHFRVPYILEVNAPLVLEQQEMRGLALPLVAGAAERHLLTHADHVIVVSEHLRKYVTEHGIDGQRVTVIPNAADPQLFLPRTGPSLLRRRLGWEGHFVIGFTGSMKPWHGISTLVEAMHMLGGESGPFRLLLVGSGPDVPALVKQVAELGLAGCVHFAGAQPHEHVPEMLHVMDVAVASYASDANDYFSPLKLFEYMAMARPVVAARMGQVCDVVEHGRTGWLVHTRRCRRVEHARPMARHSTPMVPRCGGGRARAGARTPHLAAQR